MAEKVVVQLVLDTSKYTSNANKAAKSTNKITKSADDTGGAANKLSANLGKLGIAMGAAFAAKAAVDFAKQSINAFSDLEESINAVNVSYLDGSDAIHALGENSAEQFGLSTAAVNDAAVAMSAFADKIDEADPPGAFANVLQRATDFASVMNLEVDEALRLFQSGLAGESEPLRKFGIDVSAATVNLVGLEAGITDGTGAMSEGEKVQARFLAIMEQTEKTAGDFANTSDGLANTQKILNAKWVEAQAVLGGKLAPTFTKLLEVATKLIPLLGPVGDLIGAVADQVLAAFEVVEARVDVADSLGLSLGEAGEGAEEAARGFTTAEENAAALVTPLGNLLGPGGAVADVFGVVSTEAERVRTSFLILNPVLTSTEEAWIATKGSVEGFVTGVRPVGAALATMRSATRLSGEAAGLAAERFQAQADAMRDVANAAAEAASPLLRAVRAQNSVAKATNNQAEAEKALTDAVKARGGARSEEDIAAANLVVQDSVLGVLEADLSLLEAQIALDVANANLIGRLEEGEEALLASGDAAGFTADEMQRIFDLIGTFPSTIPIDMIFSTSGQFERVESLLGRGDFRVGGAEVAQRRQSGGPVDAGGAFLVGERGPELFLPNQSGQIVPNGGFGGTTINIHQPETTDLSSDLAAGLIAGQVTQQVEMLVD